jgi:hypothetical protein
MSTIFNNISIKNNCMEIIDDNNKDPKLWRMAKKRASFKSDFYSYLVINGFLWLIWYFSGNGSGDGIPWPVWPTLGWGIGIAFQYFESYHGNNNEMAEREYEKLKNERKN